MSRLKMKFFRPHSIIILGSIIFLAAFLRFYTITQTPPSLSHDEVAIGYNAWSILQTGKDEYGASYPVLFRSFDDYKLPGYIYFTSLAEAIFGLNAFSVRFTSAFLGSLTVILLYFLVNEMLREQDSFYPWIKDSPKETLSIFAAAVLAVSPWHINFSRGAFESNGSIFFIVFGTYLLFLSLRKKKAIIFAAISFAFSLYFYYTTRVLVPSILLAFFIIYRKKLFQIKKEVVIAIATGGIFLTPLLPAMFSSGLARVNQVSIFESKEVSEPYRQFLIEHGNKFPEKLFYNSKMAYALQFVDNYLKNFNLDYYFTTGTGPMGLLYLWELPFVLLGIYVVLRNPARWKWIPIVWMVATPIVGGVTMGQPNALRTLPNAVIISFFTALGLYVSYLYFQKYQYRNLIYVAFSLCILFFFFRFLSLYFVYYPPRSASMWGDGHKQMAAFIREYRKTYDYIFITGANWRPYIYLAFYIQYPPEKFQKHGSRYGIENIEFGKAKWDRGEEIDFSEKNLSLLVKKKTLFVLTPDDFAKQQALKSEGKVPYTLKVVKEINGIYVKPAFYAVLLE